MRPSAHADKLTDEPMIDVVREFFLGLVPVAQERIFWHGGATRLQLEVYVTEVTPPLDYTTSVRGVVITDAGCAVLRNADGRHVLPGGRREANEDIVATLHREVREETGCSVASLRPLGLLRFHHLTAKPSEYAYPYPDFIQAVFAVRGTAGTFAGDPERYELDVEFVAPSELASLVEVPAYQRFLAAAALKVLS
jgi:8-oxo-dGTP pyrophosphatase MutT (NUDIX family)